MASAKILLTQVSSLPPICVCCGEPAARLRRQEFPLQEAMSAAILAASAMLGGLLWTKRSITLNLPVCEYHRRRGRRSNRTFLRGTGLTAALGIATYVASEFDGAAARYLGVAAMLAFIVTIVAAMHEVDDGLKVKSPTNDSLTLSGVNGRFAEAAEMMSGSAPARRPNEPGVWASFRSGNPERS